MHMILWQNLCDETISTLEKVAIQTCSHAMVVMGEPAHAYRAPDWQLL